MLDAAVNAQERSNSGTASKRACQQPSIIVGPLNSVTAHLKWIFIMFYILRTQIYLLDVLHDIIKSILRISLNDG